MKNGLSFSFPWMNEEGQTRVEIFSLKAAVEEWITHRKKNKIRMSTIKLNELALNYLVQLLGERRALDSIDNNDIQNYIDMLDSLGLSDTTINIHLRTVKSMMRYYHKMGKVTSVPVIDQRKIPKTDPIYITDDEFQRIMELDWLDNFYKRVFFFYRETGPVSYTHLTLPTILLV